MFREEKIKAQEEMYGGEKEAGWGCDLYTYFVQFFSVAKNDITPLHNKTPSGGEKSLVRLVATKTLNYEPSPKVNALRLPN